MFEHDCLDTCCFGRLIYMCFVIFFTRTCSAQLSMFHMERRCRNTLIILLLLLIIIIVIVVVVVVVVVIHKLAPTHGLTSAPSVLCTLGVFWCIAQCGEGRGKEERRRRRRREAGEGGGGGRKKKKRTQNNVSTKTECDYLNGWIKKRPHTQKSHPKMVNPRDIAGERRRRRM